jgi:hypothetical protein
MELIKLTRQVFVWLCHNPVVTFSGIVLLIIVILARIAREKEAY